MITDFSMKVEQCGFWLEHACTTMFFLIPKHVTSERPIALLPTLIRWWEWLRAPLVRDWKSTKKLMWNAAEGHNCGAERTASEALLEM